MQATSEFEEANVSLITTTPLAAYLTGYYGLYQAAHVLVNIRGTWLLSSNIPLDFPAPPPAGGWPEEVVHFMIGIGLLDTINALAALVFTFAYFTRRAWCFWLGNLTLSISVYAFSLYLYWTYASNAWVSGNLFAYVFVVVTFLPILMLWCFYCIWGARARLRF